MTDAAISSRRRRIFAFMIDHITMSFLAGMGGLLAMGKHWDTAEPGQMMSAILPIILVVFVVYFMKDSVRGMSPGRFILGIAVRDEADLEKCPNIFRLALRNLLIVIWPIEFLVLTFSKEKRRLGDRLAKTIVIRREDIPSGKRVLSLLGLIVVIGLLFLGGISTITKNSSAYEHAIAYIEDSAEIKEKVGKIAGYGSFPNGSVQMQNQHGYAQIKIKVNGAKNSVPVVVTMQKTPDTEWQLQALDIME